MSADIANLGEIMTVQDWLTSEETIARSRKSYAHFDPRVDLKKKGSYVTNPSKISHHSFYPFIHFEKEMVKYSAEKGRKEKVRDICYAAHIDRCIYQYYSFLLNEKYNERVRRDGISECVVAYRTDLHESNIESSKRAIDFIKSLQSCYVMIGDFTHFFDNLDHEYLKKQWCSLLQCSILPNDHYKVYRSVTSYSRWELSDLLSINGLEDDRKGHKALNSKYRVLSSEQFNENRSHISKNKESFGIPQGSPISATLANVYMMDVDKQIHDAVLQLGGMYMRYSDDFIIVIPDTGEENAKSLFASIHAYLHKAPRLTLEHSKTQYFHYCKDFLENCGKTFNSDADCSKRYINFLGFTFDGKKVYIRSKAIGKYYYRMYRKAKGVVNCNGYTPKGTHISCKNLYQTYSERGAYGKRGNFLTYVNRGEKVFGPDEAITNDTKRHMQKIRKALKSKS